MNKPPLSDHSISVRLVTAHPGGIVTGTDVYNLAHFGGILPNVGDVFLHIRTEDDYDTGVTQRRYHVTHSDLHVHWTLAMRSAPPSPEFTGIVRNALAVSNYLRATEAKRPMKEIVAHLRRCGGGSQL